MSRRLSDVDFYRTYLKWKDVTGPFRCFFRSPNFVSLKHYPDFDLIPASIEGAVSIDRILEAVNTFDSPGTLFFLDIPGEKVIEAAYFLNKEKGIKPVLTFNNVMHPFGLIGTKKYISNLIGYADLLDGSSDRGWIFALDQQRYGDYSDSELKKNFNNQYELTEEDLPPLEMLKDLNIERAVYIYSEPVKEDMSNYFEYLENNNFPVFKVELEN